MVSWYLDFARNPKMWGLSYFQRKVGGEGGVKMGINGDKNLCCSQQGHAWNPQKWGLSYFQQKGWVWVKLGMTGDKSLWCSWQGHDTIAAPKQTSLCPESKRTYCSKCKQIFTLRMKYTLHAELHSPLCSHHACNHTTLTVTPELESTHGCMQYTPFERC